MLEFFAHQFIFFLGEEETLAGDHSLFFGRAEAFSSRAVARTLCISALFPGMYRVEVRFEGALDASEFDFVDEHTVNLPHGNLALMDTDVSRLGTVKPGAYRAQVGWSCRWESEHCGLEHRDEYPAGDGPDGVVILTWLRPCAEGE